MQKDNSRVEYRNKFYLQKYTLNLTMLLKFYLSIIKLMPWIHEKMFEFHRTMWKALKIYFNVHLDLGIILIITLDWILFYVSTSCPRLQPSSTQIGGFSKQASPPHDCRQNNRNGKCEACIKQIFWGRIWAASKLIAEVGTDQVCTLSGMETLYTTCSWGMHFQQDQWMRRAWYLCLTVW